ncbi:tetratricopeptide repeat protein [Gloeobacter kilaueensis]|uniref:TPR repeat-containing protein n=1 Tax=Gloeobacter kilaueensis (strain ATCC BAA-2537 / CCAP 1431/1 / ULC 316 / JS1) TaxID=1183438 RepID=U5QHW8_GLOK1|nr:tetratricopeptide repeat protein [Gloeobacter kilaueensis]AGY58463.1 TPR repeat-containing protein [Gloeobacter kilaueensis JS1]
MQVQRRVGRFWRILTIFLLFWPAALPAQDLSRREHDCALQKRGLAAGRNRHLNACVNYGWQLHLQGRNRDAIGILTETASLVPDDEKPLNALGVIYLFTGNYSRAVEANRRALQRQPNNEVAFYNLSLGLWELGRFEEAARAAREATRLDSTNPHPWVALAIAEAKAGRPDLAQSAYAQAIRLDRRYRQSPYLARLKRSDFSDRQIAAARALLHNR